MISSEGVEVDQRKLKAVKNWPRSLAPTDINCFIGLAGYYRRLVDRFEYIASTLTTLTQRIRNLSGRRYI